MVYLVYISTKVEEWVGVNILDYDINFLTDVILETQVL